jgi:prenyltransferase beta subunit
MAFVSVFAGDCLASGGDEKKRDRQSIASARDMYARAIAGFANGDEEALHNLGMACRMYGYAVSGDPEDFELFLEACRAKRLLAEKTGVVDERSVDKSLNWLARNRNRGGGWSFHAADEQAGKPDRDRSVVRATSVALLALLGAGKSQIHGEFRNEVEGALTFLVSECSMTDKGLDCRGANGDLEAHAMATMVLCEVYATTEDRRFEAPAELAVYFLESLQNQDSGGWSNSQGAAASITTTAWCVMALQSAKHANIDVEPETKRLVEKFLDNLKTEKGAFYGETKAGKEPRATAAGLLCRCLLGLDKKNAQLIEGANYLADPETIGDDAVARFFATQVIFHVGGDVWKTWNRMTRERLLATQDREGADSGRWLFDKDIDAASRGPVWSTAVASLTLETYYRYLHVFENPLQKGLVEIGAKSKAEQ